MPNSMWYYCQTCWFELSKRGFKRRTLSVLHRKGKLIRAMLERNCITHAEIARRIGLTRERVRQLALQMGFADGRSRHAICRMERRKKEMAEFFVEAQKTPVCSRTARAEECLHKREALSSTESVLARHREKRTQIYLP